MSRFAEWITRHKRSAATLATELQCSPSTVYSLKNGHTRPSVDMAVAISRLSGGEVPVESWVPEAMDERHTIDICVEDEEHYYIERAAARKEKTPAAFCRDVSLGAAHKILGTGEKK